MNKGKLLKSETTEPMYQTWGRIRSRINQFSTDKRLKALVEKFNHDMAMALVEENHWIEGPDGELILRSEVGYQGQETIL